MLRRETVLVPPATSPFLFWAVVLSTIGTAAYSSLTFLFAPVESGSVFSSTSLISTVLYELLLALLWVPVLRRRGWRLTSITHAFRLRDVAHGLGLSAVSYAASGVASFCISLAGVTPAADAALTVDAPINLTAIVLVSAINPIFEEFIHLGFIANLLRQRSDEFALVATVVARTIIHLYQGPEGAAGIVALGALWAAYYFRTGRLWPVILAHAIMDAVGLLCLPTAAV